MKNKSLILVASSALLLSACGSLSPQETQESVEPLKGEIIADFTKGESEEFYASSGWSNGGSFDCVWDKKNVKYEDGKLKLGITEESVTSDGITYPYTASEIRSRHSYDHGDFEIRMKPSNAFGSVSTFYTYTGPYDLVDGVPNKHDEIDIEFLGKDTTKVQFNYFVSGQGGHEHMYNLGFDASKEFHNYGFRWDETKITWLVDGKAAYSVNRAKKEDLPTTPMRIFTNYWPSNAAMWSGKFDRTQTDKVAEYEWIKASGETSYTDGEKPIEGASNIEDLDWSDIEPVDLSFNGNETYSVSKENGVSTVTYDSASGWTNVRAPLSEEIVANKRFVNVTLKNNSATATDVRVDVKGEKSISTGESSSTDCLNVNAYAEGHSEINTDLSWGGTRLELSGNEEVELIVEFDQDTEKGKAKELLVYLDSLQGDPKAHEGGSVSISNIRFSDVQEPAAELSFGLAEGSTYVLSPAEGPTSEVEVTYSGIKGNSYMNIGAPLTSALVEGKNLFSVTLENKGDESINIRAGVQGQSENSFGSKDLNLAAYAKDNDSVKTDLDYGGSYIDLPAREKQTLFIEFDDEDERGEASYLIFFIDSGRYDDDAVHSGDLLISNIHFTKGELPKPAIPEIPDENEEFDWELVTPIDADFSTERTDLYTITKAEGVTTATYSKASGWANIEADVSSFAPDYNAVNLTLKNNSESSSEVRVDVVGQAVVGNRGALNLAAYAEGHSEIYTDLEWGGSKITLAAGEEVEFIIIYDNADLERGAPKSLVVFMDSLQGDDVAHEGGSISISNIRFASFDDDEEEEDDIDLTTISGTPLALNYSGDNCYNLSTSEATESIEVTYSGVQGNSYQNIGAGLPSDEIEDAYKVGIDLENKGQSPSTIRIDVKSDASDTAYACYAENHDEVRTDLVYGGSFITLAAGEKATFIIGIDQEDAPASYLMFMIDSAQYDDDSFHDGDIVISNVIFEA